jgi:hypothetical protein
MNDRNKPTRKNDLGGSMINTLKQSGLIERGIDFLEVGWDTFTDQSEIVKEVPILGTLVSVGKAGFAIRDLILIKKISTFLNQYNSIDEKFRSDFIKKAEADSEYRKAMGEHIINTLDHFDQIQKADAFAKFFAAYLGNKITYSEFMGYSYALDKIDFNNINLLVDFYKDLEQPSLASLEKTRKRELNLEEYYKKYYLNSFAFSGLVAIGGQGMAFGGFIGFSKNEFGNKFLEILNLL